VERNWTQAPDLARAAAAGFPVLESGAGITPDPAAVRLLPPTAPWLGVSIAGDVLRVVVAQMPSPSLLREIEHAAGMLVAVEVTTGEVLEELRSRTAAGGAPWMVGPAMEEAIRLGASDLHLGVGTPPIVRVDGALRPLERWPVLSAADLAAAASWIAGDLEDFSGDLDRSVTFLERRWRVNIYRQRNALAMALRVISSTPPPVERLGLPASVVGLGNLHSGLVLFCGATGSGKSTSLAALIDRINNTRACHILTIEDPIEYLHSNKRAIVHQREIGIDTTDFATGLRSSLRQDPDVILVGELRDIETMRTALAAAETGHLVLATVHASSTASAVTRIVASFPDGEQDQVRLQLAGSLQAAVYQTLLPSLRGGRVLAAEVLLATSAVRNLIREDQLHALASVLDSSIAAGMTSIDRSLAMLVAAGTLDPLVAEESIRERASYDQHLAQRPDQPLGTLDPLLDLPSFGGAR
jgi:twitching motility protein PilT